MKLSGIAGCETNARLRSAFYQNFRDARVYPIQCPPRHNAAADLKDRVGSSGEKLLATRDEFHFFGACG